MLTPPTPIRIIISLAVMAICWFVSGIAFGLYLKDPNASFAYFIWSIPFFAVAWAIAGLPIVFLGTRILKIPTILFGVVGALAGILSVLIFFVVFAQIANGTVNWSASRWPDLRGLPAFGAGNGACAVILYQWLLSREVKRGECPTSGSPP